MIQFLTLYTGPTIGSVEAVALSADPDLVRDFADRLSYRPEEPDRDPASAEQRRNTLRLVRDAQS